MPERSVSITTSLYKSEIAEIDAIKASLPRGQQTRPGVIRALLKRWRETEMKPKAAKRKGELR